MRLNPIIRWYNQNRNQIWAVVIIVGIVLIFISAMNGYYKNKMNEDNDEISNTTPTKETINNEITGQLESTTSLISGNSVRPEHLENHIKIIDEFISKCNQGKTQEAYDLLTEECKEEVFPTLESFENKYYNNVFATPKTYSIQNWSKSTYKVTIVDDALATGKVSATNIPLQEYMTIEDNDDLYKLSINNYIGRTIVNRTQTENDMEITYVKKETYMNYEEYTIKIKNLSSNEIILDNGEETDTIYLLDSNSVKEYVNTGEINYETLKLMPGVSREYTFRFSNTYSASRKMKSLVFEKAIVDNTENNYEKILINL